MFKYIRLAFLLFLPVINLSSIHAKDISEEDLNEPSKLRKSFKAKENSLINEVSFEVQPGISSVGLNNNELARKFEKGWITGLFISEHISRALSVVFLTGTPFLSTVAYNIQNPSLTKKLNFISVITGSVGVGTVLLSKKINEGLKDRQESYNKIWPKNNNNA